MTMNLRPEWLEKYRVQNVNKGKRGKRAVYIDHESNIVKPTHFNLQGGTYCVPRDEENDFLLKYIGFVFGDTRGSLALTESAIVTSQGTSISSVFIDLDFKYPPNSEGK